MLLLLCGIDGDARTIVSLLALDAPQDPTSLEATIAAEGVFERDPPDSAALPALLNSLAARFGSDIPLISVEAASALARLAPLSKHDVFAITQGVTKNYPWVNLGTLLLRLLTDDSEQVIECFKEFLSNYQPIHVSLSKLILRDETQQIPEEGRGLQDQIIRFGLDRLIASHDVAAIAEFFTRLGQLRNVSVESISLIQKRLTDIGLPEVARSLWKFPLDTSFFTGMGDAIHRWRKCEAILLRLIMNAVGTRGTGSKPKPPFLVLSVLMSALGYWRSSPRSLAAMEGVEPAEDKVGAEVVRALSYALELDFHALGAEASSALEHCLKNETNLFDVIEVAAAEPRWAIVPSDQVDPRLIARGILHHSDLISLAAANAIGAGLGTQESAALIADALDSEIAHIVQYATAVAEECLGETACSVLMHRLKRPICATHVCIFHELARLCGEKWRDSTIREMFCRLQGDNAALATGIAECLVQFSPALGEDLVQDLRNRYIQWTERPGECGTHGVVARNGTCPKCRTILPSPRCALLRELDRLGDVSSEELVELCSDARHDVSNWAKDRIIERAANDEAVFTDILARVSTAQVSAGILDRLLKLPIQSGTRISQQLQRMIESPDMKVRLAVLGQLTGGWIDRSQAVLHLRAGILDSAPEIRTISARVLRLLE